MLIAVRQGAVDVKLSDDFIRHSIEPYGVSVTAALAYGIRAYIGLLARWNARISLTTVTEPAEILQFHFGESMFAAAAVPVSVGRLADVGTGAGFPGIPIKMVSPDISLFLVEANSKKATFLAEVVRELGLKDVEVVRGRVESMPPGMGRFDFIAARALGRYGDLLRLAHGHLLAPGGRILLWLGEDEMRTLRSEPGWNFREPIAIPRAKRRFLLVGSPDDQNVPRGTLPSGP